MVGILLNIVLLNITIHETSIWNRKNGWISQSMSWILVRCLSLTNCLTSDSISNCYVYRKRAHFDWLCEDLSPFLGGLKWASERNYFKVVSFLEAVSTSCQATLPIFPRKPGTCRRRGAGCLEEIVAAGCNTQWVWKWRIWPFFTAIFQGWNDDYSHWFTRVIKHLPISLITHLLIYWMG